MKVNSFSVVAMGLTMALVSCEKRNHPSAEKPVTELSPYLHKVYEYKPAPGQFINEGSSDLSKTAVLVGAVGKGLVSLGAYGGYIVFGFDHPVTNGQGMDLGIYSNPLIGSGAAFSEPGIVCVMQDENKNGLPDDVWYELAGSEYLSASTIRNYRITYYKPTDLNQDIRWTDNQGKEGLLLRNRFHAQDYFPAWVTTNELSFTGTLLSNTLQLNGLITNSPMGWGYADNGSADYIDLQAQLGRGYNTFDINWAVDKDGRKTVLTTIDFVKIYTGQNCNGNPFSPDNNQEQSRFIGEISTEFAGALDLQLLKK